MTREQMIDAAIEIVRGSMQDLATTEEEARREAETLTDAELILFLKEAES